MEAKIQINFSSVVDSLTVQGVGNDATLVDNQKSVLTLTLPLRPDSSMTAYYLNRHDTIDTLTIWHQNERLYVSLACGCAILHTLDSVHLTTAWTDSIEILNATVETTLQENLTIYAD